MTTDNSETEFTAKSRRLFNQIRSLESEGLSGRQQLATLRSRGFSISDAAFWRARRKAQSFQQAGQRQKFSRNDYVPDAERFPENEFILRGQFQWIVKVTGTDVNGEETERFITIFSNEPQSKEWVYEKTADALATSVEQYGFEEPDEVEFELVESYRKPGAGE